MTVSFENNLFFVLTLILLGAKLFLFNFLGREVIGNKKRKGKLEFDFLFATFILLGFLFISRLFYMYIDFFLTQNNPELYHLPQNVIYWKLGGFMAAIGIFILLFIIERTVLNFKLKGIPAFLLLLGFFIVLVYPVNSKKDFLFLHVIVLITLSICTLIPAILIYVGIKAPEIRKISFLFALGVILYLIGVFIVSSVITDFIESLFRIKFQIASYFLFLIFKISGLIIVAYCATNLYIYNYFTKIDD